MPRLLIMSRYGNDGASSRVRLFQYIPALKRDGWEVNVSPLHDDSYLRSLYAHGNRSTIKLLSSYLRRLSWLRKCRDYDLIWIEKELFPFLPSGFESLIRLCKVPYIVDYDDAIFHGYDQHRKKLVRKLLSNKLDGLISGAFAVTPGNPYLTTYCQERAAKRVLELPTIVDTNCYQAKPISVDNVLKIGWIGSPATTSLLEKILPWLAQAAVKYNIKLVTIGASELRQSGLNIEQHQWLESEEARLLQEIDIGIMPLSDTPFERGKCGFKLIQYMASGRPVIASPIGVNRDIVTSETGILATSASDWVAAIGRMSNSKALRIDMGHAARERVENHYSLEVTVPQLLTLFKQALK